MSTSTITVARTVKDWEAVMVRLAPEGSIAAVAGNCE